MKYIYFVSYFNTSATVFGFGSVEMVLETELTGLAEIRFAESELAKSQGYTSVTIISFQLLRTETE